MKVVKNWDELLEVVEDEFLAVIKAARTAIKEQCPIAYEFLSDYSNFSEFLVEHLFTDEAWEGIKSKLSEKAVALLEEPITTLVPNTESIVIGNYVTNVITIFELDETPLFYVFKEFWSDGKWIADYFYDGEFEENEALKEAVSTLPAD